MVIVMVNMEYNNLAVGFRNGNTITVVDDRCIKEFVFTSRESRVKPGHEYYEVDMTIRSIRRGDEYDWIDDEWYDAGSFVIEDIIQWVTDEDGFNDSQKNYIREVITYIYNN